MAQYFELNRFHQGDLCMNSFYKNREKQLSEERVRAKEDEIRRREIEISNKELQFDQRLQNEMSQ